MLKMVKLWRKSTWTPSFRFWNFHLNHILIAQFQLATAEQCTEAQLLRNVSFFPNRYGHDCLYLHLISARRSVIMFGCVQEMKESQQWCDLHQSEPGLNWVLWENSSVSPVSTKDCSGGIWEMLFYNESLRQRHIF